MHRKTTTNETVSEQYNQSFLSSSFGCFSYGSKLFCKYILHLLALRYPFKGQRKSLREREKTKACSFHSACELNSLFLPWKVCIELVRYRLCACPIRYSFEFEFLSKRKGERESLILLLNVWEREKERECEEDKSVKNLTIQAKCSKKAGYAQHSIALNIRKRTKNLHDICCIDSIFLSFFP